MIQVQIASTLDASGVSGVRWVLVDPSESMPATAEPGATEAVVRAERPAPTSPTPPVPGLRVRRTSLALHVVCGVVLVAALVAAWWVAGRIVEGQSANGRSGAGSPSTATQPAVRPG